MAFSTFRVKSFGTIDSSAYLIISRDNDKYKENLLFILTRLHKFNILALFYLAPFSFLFIFHLISRSIFFLFLFIYIFLSSDTRYSISNLEKLRCQKIIFVGLIYLFGKKNQFICQEH